MPQPATTAKKASTRRPKYDPTNPTTTGSWFGNLGRQIFSKENVDLAIKSGINAAATKLGANAAKGSEQNAIAYEAQKAQTAAAETLAAEAKAKIPTSGSSTPKWVLPVGIGAGVLILGTIVYFIVKK